MSRKTKLAVKIGLPILILIGAGLLTYTMIASRERPAREEPERAAALVETSQVHRDDHRLDVRANGEVVPARQVVLQPEVSGRIVEVNPQLVPGGLIEEGEQLVQIDREDYELAVEQRRAALAQARAQLELERGQQEVAEREWKMFREEAEELTEGDIQDPSLALREPQMMSAKADVEATASRLEAAKLNLRRTSIEAPFDAVVRDESVDIGQLAGPQAQLATLVGTDRYWVRVALDTDKIPQIAIPNVNADEGSPATVQYEIGDRTISREARVVRLLGDLEPEGRMARLLVQIDDPLGLGDDEEDRERSRGMPLLLGAYVDLVIEGDETRELVELPRRAVRNGDEVYVMDEGTLDIRKLDIVWRRPESVLVDGGVSDGETVVVGPLPSPVEGMRLESENGRRSSEDGRRTSESDDGRRTSEDAGEGDADVGE